MTHNVKLLNNYILVFIIAIIVSALVAHTLLVPVAMVSGLLASLIVGIIHKYRTKDVEYKDMSLWKVLLIDSVIGFAGAQMAWVALLI